MIEKFFSDEALLKIFNERIQTKPSIGLDRVSVLRYRDRLAANLEHIRSQLTEGDFSYTPYLERLVIKSRQKPPRLLSVPATKDKIVLNAVREYLHEFFPAAVNRELVNVKVSKAFAAISGTNFHALKADITGFYDNINQSRLLTKLQEREVDQLIFRLIEKAIQNPTVSKNYRRSERDTFARYVGIPQGLPISNVLANLYLEDLDTEMDNLGLVYFRYVDDILLIGTEEQVSGGMKFLTQAPKRRNLDLNQEKTAIFKPGEKFIFLGYQLSTTGIEIKQESIQRHVDGVFAQLSWYNDLLRGRKPKSIPGWVTQDQLIERLQTDLNEKITGAISGNKKYGWVFYFSSVDSSAVLHRLNKTVRAGLSRVLGPDIASKIRLKNYVRTYYEITRNPTGGYIHNYDKLTTYSQLREYLDRQGYLDPRITYPDEEILNIYETIRNKHLSEMQLDLGNVS